MSTGTHDTVANGHAGDVTTIWRDGEVIRTDRRNRNRAFPDVPPVESGTALRHGMNEKGTEISFKNEAHFNL